MITIEEARALTGHTEGPWKFSLDEQRDEVAIGTGYWDTDDNGFSEFEIATVWSGMGEYSSASDPITDQCAANARLIAAAPDLLALALAQADEIERLRLLLTEVAAQVVAMGAEWISGPIEHHLRQEEAAK